VAALIGTILPMFLIAGLGVAWIVQDQPTQIQFTWQTFFPSGTQTNNLAFLTNVLFGLLGLEMAATHAAEMRNPQKDYPRSIFISVIIILATIVLASLAIALVVPRDNLSLATGIMQAFTVFADTYNLPWLSPLIAACIILGGLGGVGAWIIGPTKGLHVASQDGSLPAFLAHTNQKGVPVRILMVQAAIVSALSLIFILMPSINSSYWVLSVITAQLALLVYIALFAAALKLHYNKPKIPRSFRVPGKKFGIWLVCTMGIFSSFIVIFFGFWPPSTIPFKSLFVYEIILVGGIAICCILPLFLIKKLRLKRPPR
jgi:amino acid transporter